jgi:hypothetical protein
VVIFHDGLPQNQEAAFRSLWPRCRFLPFARDDVTARLGVPVDDARVAAYFADLSPLVLAKLELPDLLADYDQVVWLDDDVLVRGPLDGLWDFECLAWRPLPQGAFARRARVLALFADQGLDPAVPLLNGGVIGVARGFADRGGTRAGVHAIARRLIAEAPPTQLAEMPWYLVAATLRLPVTAWPLRFNHPVATPGVGGACILHAIGPHKFWNATPLRQLYPDWARHHATWVACGGAPYDGPLLLAETHPDEPSEVLRAAEMRAFWLGVFDDLRPQLPPGVVPDLRHDRKVLRLHLSGRPDAQHLALVRVANARRLGLRLHLPDALADRARAAVERSVTGLKAEKGNLLSLPRSQMAPALAALVGALTGA